jgi:prepilin-type N-terminal cleavage/methylation domain-containing protein
MTETNAMPLPTRPLRSRRQRGFSIIEVLIASVLLLFVALGIIPMFTMAMRSNQAGNDHTKSANYARARLEEMMQLPFDAPEMTITTGTERAWTEYLDQSTQQWLLVAGPTPTGTQWFRQTVIRQFDADDLATPIAAGDADAAPRIQLKEITVEVFPSSGGDGLFQGARALKIRTFKSA